MDRDSSRKHLAGAEQGHDGGRRVRARVPDRRPPAAAAPTLFALVPTRLLADQLADPDDAAPLTLVVQELPGHILPGSDELGDYLSRLAWPAEVEGVVLAQEIMFREASLADAPARPQGIQITAPS